MDNAKLIDINTIELSDNRVLYDIFDKTIPKNIYTLKDKDINILEVQIDPKNNTFQCIHLNYKNKSNLSCFAKNNKKEKYEVVKKKFESYEALFKYVKGIEKAFFKKEEEENLLSNAMQDPLFNINYALHNQTKFEKRMSRYEKAILKNKIQDKQDKILEGYYTTYGKVPTIKRDELQAAYRNRQQQK